jgi:hypothetical protein
MNSIELANRLFENGAKIRVDSQHAGTTVRLREMGCSSEAVLYNVPIDAVVIRLDDRFQVDRIFAGRHGECKRSDFLIIALFRGELYCLHIEMKLSRGLAHEIEHQLLGSRCFTDYLRSIGVAFGGFADFLQDVQHRYISIRGTGPRKRGTRIEQAGPIHDDPSRPLKIRSPNRIEFNKICGRGFGNG